MTINIRWLANTDRSESVTEKDDHLFYFTIEKVGVGRARLDTRATVIYKVQKVMDGWMTDLLYCMVVFYFARESSRATDCGLNKKSIPNCY